LAIIEDAAEAHGLEYKGRPCGSFGTLSVLSFYANKHVTSGEGGMILTNDDGLAERCRYLRNLCFEPERRFVHEELGWNLRMTNLQAAIGLAQIEQLDNHIAKKRRMGARYREAFSSLEGVSLAPASTSFAENDYWVFGMVLDKDRGQTATELMSALGKQGIGTRPFFWPMHEQPVFKRAGLFENDQHPVAEHIARYGLYVPSGLSLTDAEQDRVIDVVLDTLK
ncbi:MAG: DegT/DnrJ/EryC1/StrS family aminotransferase, partial [Myxococcales bacterium]|nr:DegT/DnrJ/EryC1/StrS family aminotransferase [Myxococcales bacterium]